MTLKTAKLVGKLSKAFLVISILGLVAFFVSYFKGNIEFKFLSLPVMACLISLTWLAMSKLTVLAMEKEEKEKANKKESVV